MSREKDLSELIDELESRLPTSKDPSQEREIRPLVQEFRKRSEPLLTQDSRCRMDVAFAFQEMGLYQDAVEELEQIPETDEQYPYAQARLADALYKMGKDLASIDIYQALLRRDSLPPQLQQECLYELILIFQRLEEYKKAYSYSSLLEKMSPNYRNLRDIQKRLKNWSDKGSRS